MAYTPGMVDQNQPQCELGDEKLIFQYLRWFLQLIAAVALIPPKFNHFLLKHFGNFENLKKIHSHPFELRSSVTNPNDYIISAGGGNNTKKQKC